MKPCFSPLYSSDVRYYRVKVRKSSIDVLFAFYYQEVVGGSKLHVSDRRRYSKSTQQRGVCHYYSSVCKNIHREKVSASDDYVTLGHVFPKVYYHHENERESLLSGFRHSNFQFSTLFFSGNNHNNRKSSLKLERDTKSKS